MKAASPVVKNAAFHTFKFQSRLSRHQWPDRAGPDAHHDWNLGPTGTRGWVFGAAGATAEARQILVTAVADGSPAVGGVSTGDVILGAGGQNFSGDARIQFANPITTAKKVTGF